MAIELQNHDSKRNTGGSLDCSAYENISQMIPGNIISYISGFFICLLLSAFALLAVINKEVWNAWFPSELLLPILYFLAIVQIIVQIRFFLHLGDTQSRWNIMAGLFSLILLGLVLGGSVWIMSELNGHMMMGGRG